MLLPIVAALAFQGSNSPEALLNLLKGLISTRSTSRLRSIFVNREDAEYLLGMAGRNGGLGQVKVAVLPRPPGWSTAEPYWVVFHTYQDIESDHDPIYPATVSDGAWKLGPELPEWDTDYSIKNATIDARIAPEDHTALVRTWLDLAAGKGERAPVFRLNDVYQVSAAGIGNEEAKVLHADEKTVPMPEEGDVLQAGSLVVPWTSHPKGSVWLEYSGTVNTKDSDKITKKSTYLTAWWVPGLARLPFTTQTRIVGPKAWVIRSEGVPVEATAAPFDEEPALADDEQVVAFRCDVPISYPKIIGGEYRLMAEKKVGSKTFRSYQLAPTSAERANRDLDRMVDALAWFENNLGPFPFPGYEVFDADTYYGIESYSHTLLQFPYTTTFVSHEMGHTYFGGLAPCPYVQDSWNESMTQYVDSVLYQKDRDKSLERGAQSQGVKVPLSAMANTRVSQDMSYYRGAYVMKMLEAEIGSHAVLTGIRSLIQGQRGKDTTWNTLRPYFEQAAGKDLKWFWDQWVNGAEFPTIDMGEPQIVPTKETGYVVRIPMRQSGTAQPFHLKFLVRLYGPSGAREQLVSMTKAQELIQIETAIQPQRVEIVTFPYTLALFQGSPTTAATPAEASSRKPTAARKAA